MERALVLLEEVARRGGGVGVRELARACGLKAPTAQNLLQTLVALGYLEMDPERRDYYLGLAALRLGEGAEPVGRAAAFARPFLDEVFEALGETVAAAVWYRGRLLLADWRESRQALVAVHPTRLPQPAHGLASGQVLLAHLDAPEREAYLATLEPGEAAALAERLPKVAADGWAALDDFGGTGVGAVAAPVFDAGGRCALALGCSAPLSRMDDALRERMRAVTVDTAERMTARLRGTPQRTEARA